MNEINDPEFLSELLAILVQRLGGVVQLDQGDEIGPHELSFVEHEADGKRLLSLHVHEYLPGLQN